MRNRPTQLLISIFSILVAISSFDVVGDTLNASPNVIDILVKNGMTATKGEYPEAVVIEMETDGKYSGFCSGVLIEPDVVLSAAHCAYKNAEPIRVTSSNSIKDALALPPTGYAKQGSTALKPDIQSVGVARFELMDRKAVVNKQKLWGKDLMLVFLKAPMIAPAQPLSIPSLNLINKAKFIRIVGFGENGQKLGGQKLFADMDIKVARCNPTGSAGPESLCKRDTELFAKHPTGKFDACPGDSGGPVYVRSKGSSYLLVGITSRASSFSNSCGQGVFVTLLEGERLNWIKSQKVSEQSPFGELQPEEPLPCEKTKLPTC